MTNEFAKFEEATKSVHEWLRKEYSSIRTGQANAGILDGVSVEAYGSKMPINQVASVSISGPKSLIVTPWDKDVLAGIDRAIRESNLGLSVALDGQAVRVSFPELTGETRELLRKAVREKLEEARIKVRTERERVLSDIDKRFDDGALNKDDKFRLRGDLQKLVDNTNKELEVFSEKKEKEIME